MGSSRKWRPLQGWFFWADARVFRIFLEFLNIYLFAKKKEICIHHFFRRDFEDILTVALAFDSSSSGDSSDEDDLDLLLVDAMFPETRLEWNSVWNDV